MKREEAKDFLRVGTTIYKVVTQPLSNGGYIKKRVIWNADTLRQDFGRDILADIPKYDGFCTVPSHTDYQAVIGEFLNLYEPISHVPVEGEFRNISQLLHHIFAEQYEMGLDYLQLLYQRPIQKLPILLLVSSERNTGKTTFLNFLKAVFQDNATFNTNEDFRSQFNADWAGKLLIEVDEVLLSRREDSERLKNLSTAKTYKVEAKGKDRQEVDFFAKFVLCSNNESLPVIIDQEETRYWVRKIGRLETDDTDFLGKLKREIPAFLFYLQHRELSTAQASRMWFSPAELRTEALERIMRSNRNRYELELLEVISEIMDVNGIDKFSFTVQDLLPLLSYNNLRMEPWQIRKVVKESWRLMPAPNALTYNTYQVDYSDKGHYSSLSRVGRFFTISKELVESLSK